MSKSAIKNLGAAGLAATVRSMHTTSWNVRLDPRCAKSDDLEAIYKLGYDGFGGQVSSLDKMKQWFEHNEVIFSVVERVKWKRIPATRETKVVGYYSIVPLTESATKLVRNEKLAGTQFTTDHIAKQDEVAHAYYIGGIVGIGPRARLAVVNFLNVKARELEGLCRENGVPPLFLTRPINEVGLKLVNDHEFTLADSNVTDNPIGRVHLLEPRWSVPPLVPRRRSPKETVMKKCEILLFAANPKGTSWIALDEEVREIKAKIRASEHRDTLTLISKWAVQPDDLLQALNEHKPQVVQFSGHGSATEQLILSDMMGEAKPVSKQALSNLFRTMRGSIRLVVFNACFSQPQAEAIVEYIDCAIGMSKAIGDQAAIAFTSAFYRAIGFGHSVKHAFDQALVALDLEGIPEGKTPQLLVRPGVDADNVYLVNPH